MDVSESFIASSKILLVDDITKNLQLLGTILQEYGFQVALAKSGEQALTIADNKPPDLILLDIAMPEMDGYEVCRRLKANPKTKDIPVIFLTAKTESEDIVMGFDVGGVDYVSKPFNPQELIKRVITHLELKRGREELKSLNEELIKSSDEKEKFLSIISHDLRSPFHGLLGIAQIIEENYDKLEKHDLKEYFDLLNEGLLNQFKFLENILQWGKLRRGRIEFEPIVCELNSILESVVNTLKINADHKKIKIIKNFEISAKAYCDKDLIRELFHNLIANAIKFTNRGGSIQIEINNSMRDYTIVNIIDDGIGISEENISKLFKIDRMFTTNGTNHESGAGLGLLLCKEIVEKHKGEISVQSEKNKGAKFIVKLPWLESSNDK
jgi:signal transduction histidine kinase